MSRTASGTEPLSDQQAIALLHDLVSVQSHSTREREASNLLVLRAASLGFHARVDEVGSAVLSSGDPSADARHIVLLGHIDTVPGDIPVRIEPAPAPGVLHGRGTVDAKGPLCAFVAAVAGLELPPGVRVTVVGAVEEECATSRGARHFARTTPTPHACIIGEPSGAHGVTLGYKGRLNARVYTRCESSHSAGPAPTAPELLADWWHAARTLASRESHNAPRVFDQVQARLRAMNSSTDGSHDHAEVLVSFRLPPAMTPEAWETRLRSLPESASVHIACDGHEAAHVSDRSDLVVRAISSAIRAEGHTPAPKLKTGTADMNVVAPIWRCPIAAFGPGDSALDHTPHEHILLSEYLAAIRVLKRALTTLALDAGCG